MNYDDKSCINALNQERIKVAKLTGITKADTIRKFSSEYEYSEKDAKRIVSKYWE